MKAFDASHDRELSAEGPTEDEARTRLQRRIARKALGSTAHEPAASGSTSQRSPTR
jgi:hypothetical protein